MTDERQLRPIKAGMTLLRPRYESMWPVRKETAVVHDPYHDDLTGLPNRELLLDRLHQALAQAERQLTRLVLLLLGFDGLKDVNAKYDRTIGDKLLRTVAARLGACIRGADTACRYGGDEFMVMLPQVSANEDGASLARKVHARLAPPYIVKGIELTMAVTIGAATFPIDGGDSSELLKQADIAMYRAKSNVGTPVVVEAERRKTARQR